MFIKKRSYYDPPLQMSTLWLMNDSMKGLLNHDGALCVNSLTKGPHRHCLCDLTATTQLIHSVLFIPVKRPAARYCLTGLSPTSCHGQCFIATFLPGSKALCAHTPVGHYGRDEVLIIHVIMLQLELQTRSSDSMGRSCRAKPHSGPLLELYCLWHVFGVKE